MAFFKIETSPDVTGRKYGTVAASSQDETDHVIPNGETYQFIRFYGNSAISPETMVTISFDPDGTEEILYVTHGAGEQINPLVEVTGDGVKVLRITLQNDQTETEYLGGGWEAILI